MEFIRRCQDCRRVVHGQAGNACPYCGCDKLNRLEEHAAPHARLHPPVLRLTLVFCAGLLGMQILVAYLDFPQPAPGRVLPFWQLNLLIGASTVTYLLLRRIEGDFRALFIIAFSIFALGEVVALLTRAYGINALQLTSGLFRHGLLVFSSLSLTAGAADGPQMTRHERVMFASTCGFLFLSILHLMMEFSRRENASVEDAAAGLVALAIALYAGWILLGERRTVQKTPDAKPAIKNAETLLSPESETL